MRIFNVIAFARVADGYQGHFETAVDEVQAENQATSDIWMKKQRTCYSCKSNGKQCGHFAFFLDRLPHLDLKTAEESVDALWPSGMENIGRHLLEDGTQRFKRLFPV